MKTTEAVALTYAEALERGALDHVAFERAVAVYRLRFPEAALREAYVQVAHMLGPEPGSPERPSRPASDSRIPKEPAAA